MTPIAPRETLPAHGRLLSLPADDAAEIIGRKAREMEQLYAMGEIRSGDLAYLDMLLSVSEPLPRSLIGDNPLYTLAVDRLRGVCNAAIWMPRGVLPIPGCMLVDAQQRPHVFVNAILIGRRMQNSVDRMLHETMDTLIHELTHATGIVLGRFGSPVSIRDSYRRLDYITEEAVAFRVSQMIMDRVFPGTFDYNGSWKKFTEASGYDDVASMIDDAHVEHEVLKVVYTILGDTLPPADTV